MNIRKIIREEITEDEFKWIKNVGDRYTGVDVSKDYWGGWKSLSRPFIELGLHDLNGRVLSSDYDGNIIITDYKLITISIYIKDIIIFYNHRKNTWNLFLVQNYYFLYHLL